MKSTKNKKQGQFTDMDMETAGGPKLPQGQFTDMDMETAGGPKDPLNHKMSNKTICKIVFP